MALRRVRAPRWGEASETLPRLALASPEISTEGPNIMSFICGPFGASSAASRSHIPAEAVSDKTVHPRDTATRPSSVSMTVLP